MSDRSLLDQLESGIEALIASGNCAPPPDSEVAALIAVAGKLRWLPDTGFKGRLREELMEAAELSSPRYAEGSKQLLAMQAAERREATVFSVVETNADTRSGMKTGTSENVPFELAPTLFGAQFPVRRGSFMASVAVHTAALALVVTSGIWAASGRPEKPSVRTAVITDISYVLPAAAKDSHGGGGGGDRDILQASKGVPPRFTPNQWAPPAIVVRNEQPRAPVAPTVVGPPNLSFPQTSSIGDPFSKVSGPASNGAGSGGGIGSGDDGGVGTGVGPGVGPGSGGGYGGGPYVAGGGVSAPRAIYSPEPDYSEEARKAKYQGMVILQVVVDADGRSRDIRVARSAGMGLDEKAIEAVRHWRFEPGTKDKRPVAVVVNVEVNFRLY